MSAPVICTATRCRTANSFLAGECRECGADLPGSPPRVQRAAGTRVPAAEWIGPHSDVHELWTTAGGLAPQKLSFDLHDVLDYAGLLRRLREAFAHHERVRFHDACLFFLRGSYGLWAYLNTESDLRLRGAVFGGLNHGPSRKPVFLSWLQTMLSHADAAARQDVEILIVDEVDSGTGIGTQMNVIDAVLGSWQGAHVNIWITYFAVARPDRRDDQLSKVIEKWSVARTYSNATLAVSFEVLIGTLLAYDDDDLLGIARRSHGYEVVKHEGATIIASCPCRWHQDCALRLVTAGTQNESLAGFVAAIASAKPMAVVKCLDGKIVRYGCSHCKAVWQKLRPENLPYIHVTLRSRMRTLGRRLLRRILGCRRCSHDAP